MKKIALYLICVCLFSVARGQDFYGISFKTITGENVSLKSYAGQKVFFLIMPLNQRDSIFSQLQNFRKRYPDSVKIIGILSIEDGYQPGSTSAIQALYKNMGIVLTEGMYTKKSSGAKQSTLMKWLTDKKINKHYDVDAKGIGQKFFISKGGRLYAVMPPQTSLQAPIIDQIVNSTGR